MNKYFSNLINGIFIKTFLCIFVFPEPFGFDMKIFKNIFALFFLTLTTANSFSEVYSGNLIFMQLSTANGLPNNMVNEVYQDREGFIWIASSFGLFKYDGYEIETYKSNLYTPGLLINNNVLCIEEDFSHKLWIGTHEGLCILDKMAGSVRNIKLEGVTRHRLNKIHTTRNNTVYLGYIRGLAYYDAVQDSLIMMNTINCNGDVPVQVNVQALTEDENGDLLIGTWTDGLYRYITTENRFIHYPLLNEQNSVQSLFIDSKGTLWIGSNGYGLYKAVFSSDKENISVETYKYDPGNPSSISSDYIYSIHEDLHTNTLWVGTRNGISIMNLDDEYSFANYQSTGTPHQLPVHEVNSIIRDKNGLMWLGTKGTGVFYTDTYGSPFETIPYEKDFPDYISAFYVEENGAIWVGSGFGVDYFYDNKKINVTSTKRPYGITCNPFTSEILLAIQDEGIIACRDGKITNRYTSKKCNFIPDNLVFTVFVDKKGNWWIGSYKGLGVRYSDGSEYNFNESQITNELLRKEITCIAEGQDGILWLATNNNGIVKVTGNISRPESFICQNYSMENGLLPVNTPPVLSDRQTRADMGRYGRKWFMFI